MSQKINDYFISKSDRRANFYKGNLAFDLRQGHIHLSGIGVRIEVWCDISSLLSINKTVL